MLAFASSPWPTRADPRPEAPISTVDLRVTVSRDGRSLEGVAVWRLTNTTGSALRSIPLWLYPNLFEEPAAGLEERLVPWVYPSGHSRGAMRLAAASFDHRPVPASSLRYEPVDLPGRGAVARVLAWVDLDRPFEPGQQGELRLEFAVDVPTRRARFGAFRGTTVLSDGFYPRPLPDLTGAQRERPLGPIEVSASVAVPRGLSAVLHDRIDDGHERARLVSVGPVRTDILSLVLFEQMEVRSETHRGVAVTYIGEDLPSREPSWEDRRQDRAGLPEGLPNVGGLDRAKRASQVAAQAGELLGYGPGLRPLLLVEVPMWDDLATPSGAQLLVSSQLYRLVPVETALWFHDLALARAVGAFVSAKSAAHGSDDRYVWAEAYGALAAERYSAEIHGKARSMQDLVGFASFVPIIDNLLYAPQVPFAEAYFRSVERKDALRDEPWRFMNERPDGGRLHGKLVDLVGPKAARSTVESIAQGAEPSQALEPVVPGGAAWFLAQWMGRYPSVDYVLIEARSQEIKGGGYEHVVRLERHGASLREPVSVWLQDDSDRETTVVWPGVGPSGEVRWTSPSPLERAELDPRYRLVEDAQLADGHPLSNNTTRLRWRPPLLTRLLATFDAVNGDPYVTASFALRRRFDITNAYLLDLDYTPRGYGAAFTYVRSFGRARTLNSRQLYAGPTLSVLRTLAVPDSEFAPPGVSREAATTGFIGVILGRDNRSYFWDPRRGFGWSLSAKYQTGQRDDGEPVHVGRAGAHIVGLLPLAVGHTLAAHGGLLGLVGNPVGSDLSTLSVRYVLRGFDTDETYGRAGLYAGVEYRHVLFDASAVSTPVFIWFDRLQGVLFAEGGSMTEPDSYRGLFTSQRLFAEVGYGLRLHLLVFGVQQYILAADFAVPLSPTERAYEIEDANGDPMLARRAPFKIVIGITQTF